MPGIFKEGRFIPDFSWAQTRAKWLHKHRYQDYRLGEVQHRVACILGFRNWAELRQELEQGFAGEPRFYRALAETAVASKLVWTRKEPSGTDC